MILNAEILKIEPRNKPRGLWKIIFDCYQSSHIAILNSNQIERLVSIARASDPYDLLHRFVRIEIEEGRPKEDYYGGDVVKIISCVNDLYVNTILSKAEPLVNGG